MRRAVLSAILAATVSAAADPATSPAPTPSIAPAADAVGRVRSLLEADRWTDALDAAQTARLAFPGDKETAAALGEVLYRAGRLDEIPALLAPIAAADEAPGRALAVLGLVRVAEGNDDEAVSLFDRALERSPDDRWVVFQASGVSPSRAEAVRRLKRYLDLSEGDDPDRITAAKSTMRIYNLLGERRVWIPVTRPDRVELPLYAVRAADGGIDGYAVPASFGRGKKVWLLLDTGSPGLFVDIHALRRTGFETVAGEMLFAAGGSGRQDADRGILPTVELGELRFQDALISTSRKDIDSSGRYQGILGLSSLQGYRVTLDLDRGKFVAERATETMDGAPYWFVGGQMLAKAGIPDGNQGLFLFDTGASRSVLSDRFVASLPGAAPAGPAAVRGFGGEIPGARRVRGVQLRFGDFTSAPQILSAFDMDMRSRLGGVEISGFLGLDLLAGRIVIIDTRDQKIRLEVPRKKR